MPSTLCIGGKYAGGCQFGNRFSNGVSRTGLCDRESLGKGVRLEKLTCWYCLLVNQAFHLLQILNKPNLVCLVRYHTRIWGHNINLLKQVLCPRDSKCDTKQGTGIDQGVKQICSN